MASKSLLTNGHRNDPVCCHILQLRPNIHPYGSSFSYIVFDDDAWFSVKQAKLSQRAPIKLEMLENSDVK